MGEKKLEWERVEDYWRYCDPSNKYALAALHDNRTANIYATEGVNIHPEDRKGIPWPEGMNLEEVKKWAEAQHKLIKI